MQYTARENDNTGLYYYRARYYDPVLKRFISSASIGLAGGLASQTAGEIAGIGTMMTNLALPSSLGGLGLAK